jgi:hypothetical protein
MKPQRTFQMYKHLELKSSEGSQILVRYSFCSQIHKIVCKELQVFSAGIEIRGYSLGNPPNQGKIFFFKHLFLKNSNDQL